MSDSKQAAIDAEALAKKAREEARSGGTDAPPTDAMKQKMADEKDKKAAEKAPTTKTEMGKRFKSGGVTMTAKKAKRFDEGGMVANSNYPFGQGQMSSAPAPTSTGLGNNSPLVQVNAGAADAAQMEQNPATATPVQMKKGGKVTARRGDGIAQRGKTRGRMV
jgi:hypothetical protein